MLAVLISFPPYPGLPCPVSGRSVELWVDWVAEGPKPLAESGGFWLIVGEYADCPVVREGLLLANWS
jgi:hypothetical protein